MTDRPATEPCGWHEAFLSQARELVAREDYRLFVREVRYMVAVNNAVSAEDEKVAA